MELLNCPFCGKTPKILTSRFTHILVHPGCVVEPTLGRVKDKQILIKAWNQRVTEKDGADKCPKVICLCGSTRFYEYFQKANFQETMKGNIILSVGFYPHSAKQAHGEDIGITPDDKEKLDNLHLRKIDLANEILVLNVDGYIGESTRNEITYALKEGKAIKYLEPIAGPEKDNGMGKS